jgi:hypothetical protein
MSLDVARPDGVGSDGTQGDAVVLDGVAAPTDAPASEVGTGFGGSGGSGGASGGGGSGGWDGADAPIGGSIDVRGAGGGGGALGLLDGGVTSTGGITGLGGSTSSGGNTSTGGVSTSGGATTSGGVTTSGGATGSGGSTGSGGTTASGGATSATGGSSSAFGGATTSGGATGSGGSTGSGGTTAGSGGTGDPVKSAGCGKTPTLINSGYNTLTSGGTSRQYIVRWPPTYDNSRAYRLILDFHGAMGKGSDLAPGFFGLYDLSNASTIFLAPDATGGLWAAAADTTLVDDILRQVEADLCIEGSAWAGPWWRRLPARGRGSSVLRLATPAVA